ncbi:hypothetical protein [Nocardia gamkensis]|uniref:DUF3558 domain-containing protein n=1 Tax=Nocardia gamkensis TaxID=352869 RepID=A0A7X6KZQ8_9NOCA|nr:hypothetical protein [Nocardia gamkensis]NKY25009.1 hypothetical protein [Nocardia gamkensis]NQE66796.1 hypothetical protein [Nocardia gamkensis]
MLTAGRRRGCLLPLTVGILVVLGFAASLAIQARVERAHPPAAAPADLCAAIGPALFEQLVPDGVPSPGGSYSSGPDAACSYRTADSRPSGSDAYGLLDVRVLRYGQVGWDSGAERAGAALATSCRGTAAAGQLHSDGALGDEACSAYSAEGERGTAYGSAVVRRGADLFWVDYYTHPGTAEQVRQGVTAVSLACLAGVS